MIIEEKPRKTPRYDGETVRTRKYRVYCGDCGVDKGYLLKGAKQSRCRKCHAKDKCVANILNNHWKNTGTYKPPKEELTPEIIEKRRRIV